jgi:preprotein translocase subunit YajC
MNNFNIEAFGYTFTIVIAIVVLYFLIILHYTKKTDKRKKYGNK